MFASKIVILSVGNIQYIAGQWKMPVENVAPWKRFLSPDNGAHCWLARPLQHNTAVDLLNSGVGTGGSGGSMNRGPPSSWGPRVVGPQKNFRQDS